MSTTVDSIVKPARSAWAISVAMDLAAGRKGMTRRLAAAGLLLSGCASADSAPQQLSFPAEDGVLVSAVQYGAGPKAVVLVPGGHGVGETWDLQARRLARAGFRVLSLDFRGLGGSTVERQDGGKLPAEILAAVSKARADGATEVSVVGASFGGSSAAQAAIAAPAKIDRLVLLADSGFDGAERLTGRKLFIVARNDKDGSGRLRLEGIRRRFEVAPEPKSLVVLEGSSHAQFIFLAPEGERLYRVIESFLKAP
jgi:dienelactone hydrolase